MYFVPCHAFAINSPGLNPCQFSILLIQGKPTPGANQPHPEAPSGTLISMAGNDRIVVLTRHPEVHGAARLEQAAQAAGVELHLVDAHEFELATGPASAGRVAAVRHPHLGEVWASTAVIPRLGSLATEYSLAALDMLERSGAVSLNSYYGLTSLRHKFSALAELAAAHCPVPETEMLRAPADIAPAVERLGGYPVVIKFIRGSQGVGVIIAPDAATVTSVVEAMNLVQYDVMLQRCYPVARETDLRVLVIGGEPRWAVRRRAGDGAFRANFHRGGHAEPIALTPERYDLATRATECFGLGLAGVDLIETDDGLLVLEVNGSPGYQAVEEAHGADVAAAIISATRALL